MHLHALVNVQCFRPNAPVFLTMVAGFGKCSLPSRQVALFGLSLVATVVYLRWKESQPKLGSSGRASHVSRHLAFFGSFFVTRRSKRVFLKHWIRVERTLIVEKFKRSQSLLKMAQQQQADSPAEDESSFMVPARESESDAIALAESDLAEFRGAWQEFMDESIFPPSCIDCGVFACVRI
jgi:hypothetical protein